MSRGILTAALVILVLCAAPAYAQRAARPAPKTAKPPTLAPTDAWDTFSADITLRRSRVGADGQPIGDSAPAQRYHWERSSASGRWKTTMTLAPAEGQSARALHGNAALDDRLLIARIVDDEDGSGPQIYNKDGERLRAPNALDTLFPAAAGRDPARSPRQPAGPSTALRASPSTPPRAGQRARPAQSPSQLVDNHFLKKSAREARRTALQRRHGAPSGQVRGLDRYVSTKDDRTDETLVDRQLQLPVEANVVRGGTLVSHRTISYEDAAGDLVVRRRVRTERLVSSKSGERAIVELEFSNVRLEQRR